MDLLHLLLRYRQTPRCQMSKAHANLSMGINALLLTAKNWRFLIVRIKANAFNQYVVLLITICFSSVILVFANI